MPNDMGTYGFDKALPQKGLYGTNVTFTLTPPVTSNGSQCATGSNTTSGTIYSPLAISITNVPPRTPVTLVPNQNTTLTWNADPNDKNGVIIIAEYLPSRYINKSALSAGNTRLIESTMLVTDNGSTSIPWSFFSKFPAGGHIILWVARGNYTIASNGTYNYQVGGYSAAAVWDVKVPPPVANVNGQSYISVSYMVKFTNKANGAISPMYLSPSGSASIQIPAGTYDVNFSPGSSTTIYTNFFVNSLSASGTSTTFYGVNLPAGTSSVRIGG